ncbi:hypothetical protein B0H63DRAFT_451657 [Podospora didyma]|uniref:Uncharacterized protein n=1 Tax=Podospora didyma TaxID=330526 RepID=A0AAE0KKC7_9PEZI|nr:hypothetical protein B0H63DRAFT_451657 [Podospora didyma]
MGLRLYQAPVESDIQSKPAANKPPGSAQQVARSAIRRARYAPNPRDILHDRERQRERRRRALAAASAHISGELQSLERSLTDEPPVGASGTGDGNGTISESRRALRDMASRMGILDDRVVAMFGERWATLHADSMPSPGRQLEMDNAAAEAEAATMIPPTMAMAVDPEFLPRRIPGPPTEPYATSSIRSTQALTHSSRGSRRTPLTDRQNRRLANQLDAWATSDDPTARPRDGGLRSVTDPDFFDGLGDRNRSLSPEGDHVWDTLLSTLTPDPQPPSVGSSFASAPAASSFTSVAASTATSQSNTTAVATGASSRTSFTNPNTVEESTVEPPCESGCEGSDTEGEEEDEAERFPWDYQPHHHTDADIIRMNRGNTGSGDDALDELADTGGLQRIVRNLAQRVDIPDSWWADVGLSRTLSREALN